MASTPMHRQSLGRRRVSADNRLHGPLGNTACPAPKVVAELSADNVHDIDASNGRLADQRIEARVAAVLSGVESIKHRTGNVYFSVSNSSVALYGAVHDSCAAREIEEAVRAKTGIDMIQNFIFTIGARWGD